MGIIYYLSLAYYTFTHFTPLKALKSHSYLEVLMLVFYPPVNARKLENVSLKEIEIYILGNLLDNISILLRQGNIKGEW